MYRYTKKPSSKSKFTPSATRSSAQSNRYENDSSTSKLSQSNVYSQKPTNSQQSSYSTARSAARNASSPFKSTYIRSTDVKALIARVTGVGQLVIPKDIKIQKWLISTLLVALFMFTSIANGVIIYGIESVIGDKCYSPFMKTVKPQISGPYRCPSIPDGFITLSYAWLIRIFEIGSTIHAISIGLASSAIYYLNFGLIVIYIIFFLVSLTMMLAIILLETLIFKAGLLVYFSLSNFYIFGFLIFFVIDVILMFATINLQVRWINFLI